jgi:segregation and condensation protein B
MEHTTENDKVEETVIETNSQSEVSDDSAALMRDSHIDGMELETSQQQQDEELRGDDLEDWDRNPTFPADEDLLYPGQDILELEQEFLDDEKQEDHLWQARSGLNFDTLCGAIETIIFMSDKPVSINKIKSLIDEDMPLRVIHESLTRLQEGYESKHHGLRLVEVAEGFQFRTKATYSKYVQDLFKVNSLVLSPTALEVLAILAYKQPVAKTEVDKIRGVDSGHIVRGLMDKRLVKVVGRSDEMGRPVLYGTTPEFLEVFNLANIGDLPPEHDLEESIENNVGKISDIKTIVHDGDKERFVFDDIDELDNLATSIKAIASDTEFTQSLKAGEKAKLKGEQAEGANTPKTAFEILEDYVSKQMIVNCNSEAQTSEMVTNSADPQVISDLTAGPFNMPEEEDEEEDFQMIDLDTGLPIDFDDEETEENSEEIKGIDLLGNEDDEAAELSKALDDAFERLTGEKLDASELDLKGDSLEQKEEDLFQKAEDISEQAKDLDLDLDFLTDMTAESGEESEKSSDS